MKECIKRGKHVVPFLIYESRSYLFVLDRTSGLLRRYRKQPEDAFTLIELLSVLMIVCMLFGLILGGVSYARRKSAENRTRANLQQLALALDEYFMHYGYYPDDSTNLSSTAVTNWLPSGFTFTDAWGLPFCYKKLGTKAYRLYSYGPDGKQSPDDIEAGK
jgi:prepilin-type N-terminal cleavage/methylation domain-containing protein